MNIELDLFVLGPDFRDLADPRVVEEIVDGGSLMLVPLKALENEVFGVWRDVGPLSLRESYLFLADVLVDFLDVLSVKWGLAGEQLVSDDTQAPHINLLRVLLMHYELRGHVKRGSEDQVKPGLLVELLGEAEICNFDIEVFRVIRNEQDILRLHISMGNALQVHVVKTKHHLMDDVDCLGLCEA